MTMMLVWKKTWERTHALQIKIIMVVCCACGIVVSFFFFKLLPIKRLQIYKCVSHLKGGPISSLGIKLFYSQDIEKEIWA